ncbi:LysR family transcriptional regulator [Streptomyces griseoluteus]|uniref:LysR family transcriptional regulator n=1 Tax=Streptomyces griseoluteus TaxID=29306 RepID=UPI00342376A9
MDLSLLRTFLAAYRSGSLTAAARQLDLSQPTVTAQMKSLEKQLGLQLFRRLPRGIAPTSVADELAVEIAPHVDALSAIAERGLSQHTPFPRPMHLGGPAELIGTRVLPALAPLIDEGLRLRITLGLADELLTGLSEGRFDLVVSTVRPRGRNISATPLTDEEFVLVAAPSWAERIDTALLLNDGASALRSVPVISYAEDMPLIRRFWRTVFQTRPSASPAVVVPDLRAVLNAVVAGAGMTVLPTYLCSEELASGALVKLLDVETAPLNTLFLAVRPAAKENAAVAAVRSLLLMQARLW